MEVLLDTITSATKELALTATPEELDLKLDLATPCSDVGYKFTARRVEDEVFLDGSVTFSLRFTCARCVEEFTSSYRQPMKLVIQLVADELVKTEDTEPDEFIIFPQSQKIYKLDQHLRDLITLELPMKPLCKSDCHGLCPQCGTNLNIASCSCKAEERDPRWDALRKLYNN